MLAANHPHTTPMLLEKTIMEVRRKHKIGMKGGVRNGGHMRWEMAVTRARGKEVHVSPAGIVCTKEGVARSQKGKATTMEKAHKVACNRKRGLA